jgi:GntR family transcriptional regulator, histidine utilization repressor
MRRPPSEQLPAGTALYRRIRFDIEQKILSGHWPPGHRIPFEHELVHSYNCSRMTVNKVLSGLAAAGLIERRRRTGSVVAWPRTEAAVLHIADIKAEVEGRGQIYGYELLSHERRWAAKAELKRLQSRKRLKVLALRCRHFAQGLPLALEERLLNIDAVPQALEQDFSKTGPGTWLLTHIPWNEAENRISACRAAPDEARALDLQPGAACLVVERCTWRSGGIITWVRLTFPADLYQLVARFTPAQDDVHGA